MIISIVQVIFITCQEQVATVRERESAINVNIETVKLLDFHDDTVIDNLVKSVVETEAEELVEQILHMGHARQGISQCVQIVAPIQINF